MLDFGFWILEVLPVGRFRDSNVARVKQSSITKIYNSILGESFEASGGEKHFCAPYVFSEFPDSVDGKELENVHAYAAIIEQNVYLR